MVTLFSRFIVLVNVLVVTIVIYLYHSSVNDYNLSIKPYDDMLHRLDSLSLSVEDSRKQFILHSKPILYRQYRILHKASGEALLDTLNNYNSINNRLLK